MEPARAALHGEADGARGVRAARRGDRIVEGRLRPGDIGGQRGRRVEALEIQPDARDRAAANEPAKVPQGYVARRTWRASLWTTAGYAAQQVLRFGSNLILTRILFPDVFGLAALVFLFVQALAMFSDVGIGFSVIQSKHGDDPKFLTTAWTVQCVRGVLIALAACALAYPAAAFYGQPLLAYLLPVAGLNAVIAGFESTARLAAQRHLDVRRLTLIELAAQVAGLAVMLPLAFVLGSIWPGNDLRVVWAVIAGGLANALARMVLSHTALRGIRHRWHVDRPSLHALLRNGRWVFLNTVLTFLSGQADRLVFARLVPIGVFGVYNIAAMLAMVPTQLCSALSTRVLFPAYSRALGAGDLNARFSPARLPMLLGGAAMISGLAATGSLLVGILYDDRYVQAGWIVQFLALSAWFQVLEGANSAALLAQAQMRWLAVASAVKAAGVFTLVLVGFRLDGFRGALLGIVLSDAAKYAISAAGATRQGLRPLGVDLLLSASMAAVAWLGTHAGGLAAGGGELVAVLAAGSVPTAFWGAVFLGWRTHHKRAGGRA